eukprot:scaffold15108_cov180-Amphora_coffeaeformis.AAC.94
MKQRLGFLRPTTWGSQVIVGQSWSSLAVDFRYDYYRLIHHCVAIHTRLPCRFAHSICSQGFPNGLLQRSAPLDGKLFDLLVKSGQCGLALLTIRRFAVEPESSCARSTVRSRFDVDVAGATLLVR